MNFFEKIHVFFQFVVEMNGTLFVHHANPSDAGVYECKVTLRHELNSQKSEDQTWVIVNGKRFIVKKKKVFLIIWLEKGGGGENYKMVLMGEKVFSHA